MRSWKLWLVAVLLALTSVGAGGCWDQRDINDRVPALGIGFDYTKEHGWSISMSVVRFVQGGTPPYSGFVFHGRGPDILAAMEDLRARIGREMYFGSVKIYVLGPGVLHHGLPEVIRLLEWNEEVDRTAFLIASTQDPAQLLRITAPVGPSVVRLLREFETHKDVFDGFTEEPLWDAIRSLSTPGATFQLPIFASTSQTELHSDGTALIGPQGRLSMVLDTQQSKYLRWLMNRFSREVIGLPDGQQVRTSSVRTRLRFLGSSREAAVDVQIAAVGHLVHAPLFTATLRHHLAAVLDAEGVRHITELLKAMQQAGADVPKWSEKAYQAGYPDWSLPQATIQVTVRAHVSPFTSSGF